MAVSDMVKEQGFVPFQGYRLWFRVRESEESDQKLPLLVLHGGPGSTHDYLEDLGAITRSRRPVIFFDQLGSGNSDHPSPAPQWTVRLFVEQIQAVRQALGLSRVHLLGHSWGGMLGMEYASTQPVGLESLIVANAPSSMRRFRHALEGLRGRLPAEVQETLARHERLGTTTELAYLEAQLAFYNRHLCRLRRWPKCLNRSLAKQSRTPEVYQTMFGASDLQITGTLRDWSIEERLERVRVPTLIISGRFDYVTPEVAEVVHHGIAGSEWLIFEESSHMPHLEEPEKLFAAVITFLDQVESARFADSARSARILGKRRWP